MKKQFGGGLKGTRTVELPKGRLDFGKGDMMDQMNLMNNQQAPKTT